MELETGQILVADSGETGRFSGSVILVLKHGPQGNIGVDLTTRSAELTKLLKDMGLTFIFENLSENDNQIYIGGPVEDNMSIFYIHDSATGPAQSMPIGDTGFSWEVLRFQDDGIGVPTDFFDKKPKTAIAGMSYARWETGELEKRVGMREWHVATMSLTDILALDPDNRWQQAMNSVNPDLGLSGGGIDFGDAPGGPGWTPS